MNQLSIEAAAITHIGSAKTTNEDNYYINGNYKSDSSVTIDGISDKKQRNSYTYGVFDGMGGESYGELASLLAAATLEKFRKANIRESLKRYIDTANEFICDLVKRAKGPESGSTMVLLDIRDDTARAYNIGNSRAYFYRKGCLYLLSKDHVDKKVKGSLTQFLGVPPAIMKLTAHSSSEVKLKKGDAFLLCSDGLTDAVMNNDIVEMFETDTDTATDIAKKLVAEAQVKKAKDDITVIVVKVG